MLRRRHILGAGLLLPGLAQADCAPPPVLELEGTGSAAGRISVFGQAFRPGDVPRGLGIAARMANGTEVACQLDVKTRHPDGSARHAVVAMRCPALAAGARAPLALVTAAPPGGALPLPSGRTAVLHIRTADAEWSLDLMRAFPAAVARDPWQRGPLALQGRISEEVPIRALPSLRVVVDVAARADGTIWVEAWFRNDAAMRPQGGAATYTARLLLDGQPVLEAEIPRQHQYTGWGRLVGATPPARIRHGATYLADAAAVARYGVALGVDERTLARMATAMRGAAWNVPLAPREITQDMRQGGGRPDIGPATMPQAAWLISADRRAEAFAVGQAEAAGAIPWHLWETQAGRWMDSARWPRLWADGRGGPPPGGLSQPIPADTGWVTDIAHQPDLSFVPYLLTGRRAFLDNLQAQAFWSVLSQAPGPRVRGLPGREPGGGVNIVRDNQVRGAAWCLRQLENAAWATPETDPHRPWLRAAVAGNWAWIIREMPGWTREQGQAHGRIPGVYGSGQMPPWQQDYFASTAAIAVRRGDPQAHEVLRWMANFLVGRFAAGPLGFNPRDGCAYLIAVGGPGLLQSWGDIGTATRAAGLSNEDGWAKSQGDYGQWALASLAALSDALDLPAALEARRWLRAARPPFTEDADYRRDPLLNIVPRESC